jgi:NAD+ synthase (glutamine-hydrolysing)
LYHGVSDPEKLLILAQHAFNGKYPDSELLRVRDLFFRRFFTQQFKRTAAPDGIQAGVVSLSARTGWQMPSDITGSLWRKWFF